LLDDPLANRQADTTSLVSIAAVQALEDAEDLVRMLRVDADAGDRNYPRTVPLRRADVHARGFLAVLQRVADQVLKQHCEPAFVHGDRRQVFRADRSAGLLHLASKAL